MTIAWSPTEPMLGASGSAKAVCSSGTETFAAAASDGAPISNARAFAVVVEADSGQTLSGAGTLQAWILNPLSGVWGRSPDLDLSVTVSATRGQSFAGFAVSGPKGRVAYAPSGVTVSSGGVTIYLNVSALSNGR